MRCLQESFVPAGWLMCRRYSVITILLFETQGSLNKNSDFACHIPFHTIAGNACSDSGTPEFRKGIVVNSPACNRSGSSHNDILQIAVALAGCLPASFAGGFVATHSHSAVLP